MPTLPSTTPLKCCTFRSGFLRSIFVEDSTKIYPFKDSGTRIDEMPMPSMVLALRARSLATFLS